MLRVIVDLVPFGLESCKRNLYTLSIANSGASKGGGYSYRVRSKDENGAEIDHGMVIKGFDRNRPAYELINLVAEKLNEGGFFRR